MRERIRESNISADLVSLVCLPIVLSLQAEVSHYKATHPEHCDDEDSS